MKQNIALVREMIDAVVERIKNEGEAGDLLIHETPLRVSCILDYLIRATDPNRKRLPEMYRSDAMAVAVGSGFITIESLLLWILFSLVSRFAPRESKAASPRARELRCHRRYEWKPATCKKGRGRRARPSCPILLQDKKLVSDSISRCRKFEWLFRC